MKKSKALIGLCALVVSSLFVAGGAGAQVYDSSGAIRTSSTSQPVYDPALSNTSFTLSGSCSTPTTPVSCVTAGSAKIIPMANGGADYSWQINTPNSGTFAFYSSNDGVNFFASNLSYPSGVQGLVTTESSTTAAGKFAGIGGSSAYIAIVATVAPTSAVTIYPYISQRVGAVSVHALPAVTIANSPQPLYTPAINMGLQAGIPSTSTGMGLYSQTPSPLTNGLTAPLALDSQGNLHTVGPAANAVTGSVTSSTSVNTAFVNPGGYAGAEVDISGTWAGITFTPYCVTYGGVTHQIYSIPRGTNSNSAGANSFTANGELFFDISACAQFQVVSSGYTSGTATVAIYPLPSVPLASIYYSGGIPPIQICSPTTGNCASVNGGFFVVRDGGYSAPSTFGASYTGAIKSSSGTLFRYAITSTGATANATCYDNASAASGTIVLFAPSTLQPGQWQTANEPLSNGLYCVNPSGGPTVTLTTN